MLFWWLMRYSYYDWFNWPTMWFIRGEKQTFQYTIFVTLIHTQKDSRKSKTQNRNLIYLCPQWGDRMKNYSNYSLWVTMKMHSLNTRLPHGAALSFRLVSFRNRFFLLLLLLSVCFQFVLQRVTWRTDREGGRERGGKRMCRMWPEKWNETSADVWDIPRSARIFA